MLYTVCRTELLIPNKRQKLVKKKILNETQFFIPVKTYVAVTWMDPSCLYCVVSGQQESKASHTVNCFYFMQCFVSLLY